MKSTTLFLLALCFSLSLSAQIDTSKVYSLGEVETEPEFPGGKGAMMDLIMKGFKTTVFKTNEKIYPGKHVFTFVIQRNGKVSDVKMIKPADDKFHFREQLEKLLKEYTWEPAKMNGTTVKVLYYLPMYIHFQ